MGQLIVLYNRVMSNAKVQKHYKEYTHMTKAQLMAHILDQLDRIM